MAEKFDVAVVGLGGAGSAVAWSLARRGVHVLGIDPHPPAHDLGCTHGETRLIRRAYFECPDYVPLLNESYRLWREFEQEVDDSLLVISGLYLAGFFDGEVIAGVHRTTEEYNLDIHQLSLDEARRRWPQFYPDDGMTVLYEPDAGYLMVEKSIRHFLNQAEHHGAELRFGHGLDAWEATEHECQLSVADKSIKANHIVFCAGASTQLLVPELAQFLTVRRKPYFFFSTEAPHMAANAGCPAFGIDTANGFFYGFPVVSERGLKVANHFGGQEFNDPANVSRTVTDDDAEEVEDFVRTYLDAAPAHIVDSKVCMYGMTQDEHFLMDRLPLKSRVKVACGFSGHGFKFAPVIGETIADWIANVSTPNAVEFLSAKRLLNL